MKIRLRDLVKFAFVMPHNALDALNTREQNQDDFAPLTTIQELVQRMFNCI